ncbi:peptidase M20 [Heyndrickxia sporothermodurans]|nr:peptidase M20 [Heyndrickxia sporothermodurans]
MRQLESLLKRKIEKVIEMKNVISKSIKEWLTEALINEIVGFRRDLHQYPELSGEEYETSKKIQAKLEEYGIPFKTGFAKTGVLGVINGGKPGGTVALRADIDALPIQERNEHEFVSKIEGKMHACGHDSHTAMLLGAGYILQQLKDELPGKVLLVFQPAEELAPIGGAEQMIKDGVFAEDVPDAIFAQHVWPDLPVGKIGVRQNEMMGASDRFKIVIKGSGGHASMPHQTTDAIIVANQVITSLQTIVSRNVDPLDPAVITIGRIEGGYRYNVVADEVTLEGTVRTLKKQTKKKVKERFFSIVKGVAESFNAHAEIDYLDGYPATMNTPEWAVLVKETVINSFGQNAAPEVAPSLGGEDFSRFLLNYPGVYYWLGTAIDTGDPQKPLHDPQFKLNEKAFPIGIEMMVNVAINALVKLENELT